MTPDLMKAGARARIDHGRRAQNAHAGGGGREASYARIATGELDLTHGAILYLEDITVSFDGFKALNALSLSMSPIDWRRILMWLQTLSALRWLQIKWANWC